MLEGIAGPWCVVPLVGASAASIVGCCCLSAAAAAAAHATASACLQVDGKVVSQGCADSNSSSSPMGLLRPQESQPVCPLAPRRRLPPVALLPVLPCAACAGPKAAATQPCAC